MAWVDALRGTIVGLDTAPLIYFVGRNSKYIAIVRQFFEGLDRGEFSVVTSSLTLAEVLVHPFRAGDNSLALEYARILSLSRNLTMLPVSGAIALETARLRAKYGMKTPDAIQIATAIHGGASSFLTNDIRLAKIPEIRIIVLEDMLGPT